MGVSIPSSKQHGNDLCVTRNVVGNVVIQDGYGIGVYLARYAATCAMGIGIRVAAVNLK